MLSVVILSCLVILYWCSDILHRRFFPGRVLDLASLGGWAVVTGATDGIGKAFAEQLAKLGFSLVLISRNKDKLDAVAKEISNKYSVSVKAMQAEFTLLDDAMYAELEKEVTNVDVSVLVNNVGMGYVHPEYLHELETHQKHIYQDIVNCNVVSMVRMCQYVLPGMVSRKKGLIINVSSGFADIPAPFLSLYGGTKAFVSKLSEDLAAEYGRHGIRIHCLKTGMVATKLLRVRNTSWMLPSPERYVESALKEVASLRSRTSTGYTAHTVTHRILSIFLQLFPVFSKRKLFELGLTKRNQLKGRCKKCSPDAIQASIQNGQTEIL